MLGSTVDYDTTVVTFAKQEEGIARRNASWVPEAGRPRPLFLPILFVPLTKLVLSRIAIPGGR